MKLKTRLKIQTGFHRHYRELFETADKELRYTNMLVQSLYESLNEISVVSNDSLVKKLAKIAKERHQLDKLIHARLLFKK